LIHVGASVRTPTETSVITGVNASGLSSATGPMVTGAAGAPTEGLTTVTWYSSLPSYQISTMSLRVAAPETVNSSTGNPSVRSPSAFQSVCFPCC
jgi:hypothetical protein